MTIRSYCNTTQNSSRSQVVKIILVSFLLSTSSKKHSFFTLQRSQFPPKYYSNIVSVIIYQRLKPRPILVTAFHVLSFFETYFRSIFFMFHISEKQRPVTALFVNIPGEYVNNPFLLSGKGLPDTY